MFKHKLIWPRTGYNGPIAALLKTEIEQMGGTCSQLIIEHVTVSQEPSRFAITVNVKDLRPEDISFLSLKYGVIPEEI
jgi:hypothetical protein